MLRPTVIAIPIFSLLIAFEAWWAFRSGSDEFRDRRDTWTNIFLGFVSVVFGSIIGILTADIAVAAYELAP